MDTYTLLEIATSKLSENTRFIFDPRHEDAVYTMANIPPTAISVYKTWSNKYVFPVVVYKTCNKQW